MDVRTDHLKDVMKTQLECYDRMARSIWGDRMVLAMTASSVAGIGMGMLFASKWRTRFTGALLYTAAAGMQLYAAMTPSSGRTGRIEAERNEGTTAQAA